ncbi:MAG: phytoene/squalene synthetase [Alphaproteobacteria bacterium]|nr:MAG: phytoene/squalene synthetase [Alphaproteobacteria bacterium]
MVGSYCCEMVRKHDPDRFLLSLFMAAQSEDIWALYAFNHEIARTREVVTETRLGLIRLQWWRDALAAVYDGKPVLKHQVLEPLAAAIAAHHLPREHFDNLIYAREFDLEDRQPATLEGMVKYADFTSTPLVKLALMIAGEKADDDAVSHAGTAYALTGLLRAVHGHLVQRRCYLPEDLLRKAGTDIYELYDGKGLEKLKPVAEAVVRVARENLRLIPAKPAKHLGVMRHMSEIYLDQIEKADFSLFGPRLQDQPPFLALRLWWRNAIA